MMKQANLWIMSGCPASGKSSAIKNFFAFEDDVVIVSRDAIRFNYLDKNPNAEYFKFEKEVFKEFIFSIKRLFEAGCKNVVADATHLNKYSRAKLLNSLGYDWILKNNININFIVMNTSLDECLRRNDLREGRACVPENVIIDMFKKFEFPDFAETSSAKKIYIINEDGAVDIKTRRGS